MKARKFLLGLFSAAPEAPKPAEPEQQSARLPDFGRPSRFIYTQLEPARGRKAEWSDIYAAYVAWCTPFGLQPLRARTFGLALREVCDAEGISITVTGNKAHCVHCRLVGVGTLPKNP